MCHQAKADGETRIMDNQINSTLYRLLYTCCTKTVTNWLGSNNGKTNNASSTCYVTTNGWRKNSQKDKKQTCIQSNNLKKTMRHRHKISLKIHKMHTVNVLVHRLRIIIATLNHICSCTHTIWGWKTIYLLRKTYNN